MADNLKFYDTSAIETSGMHEKVDSMIRISDSLRSNFSRRWYDNNIFDDGYHFRFVDRVTNKIVDVSKARTFGGPARSIPKASRQIRGVANLLLQNDPQPVVFPEKLTNANYDDPQDYEQARQLAKDVAKKTGHWIEEEWKAQNMFEKLALMIVLAAKNSVAWMQVWPDDMEEKIRTQVYDAFDVRVMGNLTDHEESPFMGKSIPKLITEILANKDFDEEERQRLNPDNKFASSEIKNAYVSTRFGRENTEESASTVLLNEFYIKERLNDDNRKRIKEQEDAERILKSRKDGDVVLRQVFTAAGVTLRDRYLSIKHYPFVPFRFEPGPLYQVSMIERFIPQNKSLDMVISRLERFVNAMTVGSWSKRRGENFDISNQAGGLVLEYDGTPPIQNQMASVPSHVFGLIELLNSFIDEQGVTLSTVNKVPRGVKAAAAIESLKESESSNLIIAYKMLQQTIKSITERFLDIAHDYFITPQTVFYLDKGEPNYFDVIGQAGIEARQGAKIAVPENVTPLRNDYKVEIEVQSGLGFTREGQIQRAQQLAQFMSGLAQGDMPIIPPEAFKVFIQRLLEIFQFGSVSEFMEAMEQAQQQPNMDQQDIDKMKLAMLEVMKDVEDAKGSPQQQQNQRVDETKLGVAEAVKDIQQAQGGGQPNG